MNTEHSIDRDSTELLRPHPMHQADREQRAMIDAMTEIPADDTVLEIAYVRGITQ